MKNFPSNPAVEVFHVWAQTVLQLFLEISDWFPNILVAL